MHAVCLHKPAWLERTVRCMQCKATARTSCARTCRSISTGCRPASTQDCVPCVCPGDQGPSVTQHTRPAWHHSLHELQGFAPPGMSAQHKPCAGQRSGQHSISRHGPDGHVVFKRRLSASRSHQTFSMHTKSGTPHNRHKPHTQHYNRTAGITTCIIACCSHQGPTHGKHVVLRASLLHMYTTTTHSTNARPLSSATSQPFMIVRAPRELARQLRNMGCQSMLMSPAQFSRHVDSSMAMPTTTCNRSTATFPHQHNHIHPDRRHSELRSATQTLSQTVTNHRCCHKSQGTKRDTSTKPRGAVLVRGVLIHGASLRAQLSQKHHQQAAQALRSHVDSSTQLFLTCATLLARAVRCKGSCNRR